MLAHGHDNASESINKELKKNYSFMLGASLFSAFFALVNISLTARMLGPEDFGLLVVIQAFIAIVAQVVGFQTVNAVIKFGTDALVGGRKLELQSLVRIAFWVDIITAVAGFTCAILIVKVIGFFVEFNDETFGFVVLYALTIGFNFSGFAVGILRIYDRYGFLALQQVLTPLLRLIILLVCWYMDVGLQFVLFAWVASEIVGILMLILMGLNELQCNKISVLGAPASLMQFKNFFSFLVANNIDTSIRVVSRELDVVVVGLFVDKPSAGLYKLVVQLGSILSRFTTPLSALLLPIFSRLIVAQKQPEVWRLFVRINWVLVAAILSLYIILVIVGEPLIVFAFGEDYRGVYSVLLVYLLSVGIGCLLVTVTPLMQSMGKATYCMRVQVKSTLIYFLAMLPLIYFWGLYGASLALGLYNVIWFLYMRPEVMRAFK